MCARVDGQPQAGQALFNGGLPLPKDRFVVSKKQKIIHIS